MWVSLLNNLDITQAPELLSHETIESVSTTDLRTKVLRAAHLDHSWRVETNLTAKETAAVVVKPRLMPDEYEEDATGRLEPQILPGGRFVLIENRGRLELWSVDPAACVWIAPYPREGRLDCISFAFDLQNNDTELVIAAAFIDVERAGT